jgi:hypothetical protein
MHIVAEKLKVRDTSSSPLKDWMNDWDLDTPTHPTRSIRHKSFLLVKNKAEHLLRTTQLQALRMPSPQIGSPNPAVVDWHDDLYRVLCSPYAKELAQVLKRLQRTSFVIAFDECSYLGIQRPAEGTEPSRSPAWGKSLIALQRIIKAGDNADNHGVNFWYLLLDTNSSIFDLVPSGPNAPSSRLTQNLIMLPPWHHIGFNQMVNANHAQGIKTPADVLEVRHQQAYGRPVSNETRPFLCSY